MKRYPQDEEWKQMINQQSEQNKIIMEEEKVLERAKKDLLIQQYQNYEESRQRKQQEDQKQRAQDQLEMDNKIQQYIGDQQSRVSSQKQLKNYLSKNYIEQMNHQKLNHQEEKTKNREEEQLNIQRAQQSLRQEQDYKAKQREQARLEMIEFYNSKKRLENERMISQNQQKELYKQMIEHSAQQQYIKEDKYRKYYQQFNEISSNQAKNFVPFDNNKEKRIQDMIEKGIQQDRQRQIQEEEIRRQNMISRRLDLKAGLQQQLAQKERNIYQKKQDYLNTQEQVQQQSMEQKQYEEFMKNQKAQTMNQYRDILHTQMNEKEMTKVPSSQTLNIMQSSTTPYLKTEENDRGQIVPKSPSVQSLIHNPLLNPIPNNMQNPYLLKQLASTPSLQKIQAGRLNYANLATTSIMTPKNPIF